MKEVKWTINDIPNLSGKTIIVTGGNSGLGFEAVKMFAENNAEVVLASRSQQRGEKAKSKISSTSNNANINRVFIFPPHRSDISCNLSTKWENAFSYLLRGYKNSSIGNGWPCPKIPNGEGRECQDPLPLLPVTTSMAPTTRL